MIFGRKGPWPKVKSIFGAFLLTLLKPLSIIDSFEQRSSVVSVLILWINITQVKAYLWACLWLYEQLYVVHSLLIELRSYFHVETGGLNEDVLSLSHKYVVAQNFIPLPEMRLSKASVAVGLCMWVIIWDWSEDALCKIMFTLHRVW